MSKNVKIMPELRFSEFVNEGEWVEKKLGEILIEGKLGGNYENVESNKGIPVIKMGNIDRGKISLDKIQYLPQGTSYNKDDILREGDLLFNTRNTLELVGKVAIWRSELPFSLYNSNLMRMTFNEEFIASNFFMNYFFNTEIGLRKLKSIATGTTSVAAIYTKDLHSVKINFPSIKEQQKIASCLSSLDDLIAAHSQKLELLKSHKKGLMKNLFPQEGEKVPMYRFKEFEKDGKWVEKALGEVATIFKGKGISKADIVENGYLPCIRYGELYTHYNETISTIKSYTNSNPDDLVLSNANDVIIPASGETQIDIATASCVLESGIALGGDLNIIRSKINGVFLSYYLNNAKKNEIAQMAQGIAVVHLYPNQLKTLQLQIPNPKEQQKVASCLSSLDALITAQAKKIEQLQQHKKGLMQGLFPKSITNYEIKKSG